MPIRILPASVRTHGNLFRAASLLLCAVPILTVHDFLGKAILEGAAGLVAAKGSDLDLPEMSIFTGPVVLVEDTLLALQAAAARAIDRPCPDASWRSPAA